MGLECSHDAWHGAYSRFMGWRKMLAKVAGIPPLGLMQGFYTPLALPGESFDLPTLYSGPGSMLADNPLRDLDRDLPIAWDCLKDRPLLSLLSHSDCDGEIPTEECEGIAADLESLLPDIPEDWQERTKQFIAGLRLAAAEGEPLVFY